LSKVHLALIANYIAPVPFALPLVCVFDGSNEAKDCDLYLSLVIELHKDHLQRSQSQISAIPSLDVIAPVNLFCHVSHLSHKSIIGTSSDVSIVPSMLMRVDSPFGLINSMLPI
jgi:hypothetical protein